MVLIADIRTWLNSDNIVVDVLWGNATSSAIKVCTCYGKDAMAKAREWFSENDHFFHLDQFPPYMRIIPCNGYLYIDYGSWANFLYIFPIK